ncbi:hypothetical protein CC79DRAFT_1371484 [Sarocladium strictum]
MARDDLGGSRAAIYYHDGQRPLLRQIGNRWENVFISPSDSVSNSASHSLGDCQNKFKVNVWTPRDTMAEELDVSDSRAVSGFFERAFTKCQQSACKLIAKAWVKVLEPRKQSTFPYTGGDRGAPDWWPKPWGPLEMERVRHKEPDHLYKRERIHLLVHILRFAVEPRRRGLTGVQTPDINLERLEKAAWEALSVWVDQQESNLARRFIIEDIFHVARARQQHEANMHAHGEGSTFKGNCPEYLMPALASQDPGYAPSEGLLSVSVGTAGSDPPGAITSSPPGRHPFASTTPARIRPLDILSAEAESSVRCQTNAGMTTYDEAYLTA